MSRRSATPGKLDFSTVMGATVERCRGEVGCGEQGTQTIEGLASFVGQIKEDEVDLLSPSPSGVLQIAGVEVGCILDTGAEASLIPVEVFEKELKSVLGPLRRLTRRIHIVGYSGAEVQVEGYVRAPLTYLGTTADVGFLVISSESKEGSRRAKFPVLLGCNALKALANNTDKDSYFSIKLGDSKVTVEVDDANATSRSVAVVTGFEEKILANTGRLVSCKLATDDVGSTPWLVGMEGRIPGLHVVEGCVLPTSAEFRILVVNESSGDITLPAATHITTAMEIEVEKKIHVTEKDECLEVTIYEIAVDNRPNFPQNLDSDHQCEEADDVTETPSAEETEACSVLMEDGSVITLPIGVTLPPLEPEEMRQVAYLLDKNREAFSKGEFDLGYCDTIPHVIKVTDDTPIRQPYRRIPPTQMSEVKQLLQDMMDQKVIQRSVSPYASPVVLVRKRSGAIRLCVDYRLLNAITVKDSFPLPRIEESLEALGGARYFSSTDLSHGYFQIAMDPASVQQTAFRVPWGLFEFLRLPQGLCNSPSTFQRVMEMIFGDLNLSQLVLYLDDILVFSRTFEEHLQRLDTVFQRLIKHGLKLKGEKCRLFQSEVHHLGHVVSPEGVAVDPSKVERIINWPVPKTVTDLCSFLGLASYYRRFVPGFAQIAAPLHALKGKEGKAGNRATSSCRSIQWTDEADESFVKLKNLLSSTPVLMYPQFDKEFQLEVDASLKGLGACLLQKDEEGN